MLYIIVNSFKQPRGEGAEQLLKTATIKNLLLSKKLVLVIDIAHICHNRHNRQWCIFS